MITFDNVSYSADGREIIKGVSFRIERGEFMALVGPNGAGKSTLSRLCRGLLKPSAGSVRVGGLDTRAAKTADIAKFTGFLFQNPDRQICGNTVREEITFGLRCVMIDEEKISALCDEAMEKFSLSGDDAPFTMSRGTRQRLALASVTAAKPALLILDEPTTGLDSRESAQIMERVSELNRRGSTVLMVSHDMELVVRYARSAMALAGGRVLGKGPVRSILSDTELLSRASLLPPQTARLAMRLGTGYENVFTVDEMAAAIEKHRGASKGATI